MNFLQNLLGRLFGKKREEEEKRPTSNPVRVVSAPSQATVRVAPTQELPQVQVARAPEITPVALSKAPEIQAPPPDDVGLFGALRKVVPALKGAFQDTGDFAQAVGGSVAQGIYNPIRDVAIVPSYAAARAALTPETLNESLEKARVQVPKISTGTVALERMADKGLIPKGSVRTLKNTAEVGGALATLPVSGPAALTKIAALEKLSKAARLASYTGIRAGQGAVGVGLSESSQEGATVESAFSPANLAIGAGAMGALNVIGSPKLSIAAITEVKNNLLEIAPGIKSVNPVRVQEVDQAIEQMVNPPVATMTERPGYMNDVYGNPPVDSSPLDVPTFQRNQEALQMENLRKQEAVPGQRTMNDLEGRPLSTQEMHAPDAIQEVENPQVFARPEGQGLNTLYQPFPDSPANIRPIGMDIQAPPPKVAIVADDAMPPVQPAAVIPNQPLTKARNIARPVEVQNEVTVARPGSDEVPVVTSAPAQSLEPDLNSPAPTVAQAAGESQVDAGVPLQSADPKAPRQASKLLDMEVENADKETIRQSLRGKDKKSLDELQASGARRAAGLGDEAAVAGAYANEPALNGPEDYYAALEAAKRLSGRTDKESVAARTNIYNAMLEYASSAGLDLRATQILWNDMPLEMKLSSVVKRIEKQRAKVYGGDDPRAKLTPEERAQADRDITNLLENEQKIQVEKASAESTFEQAMENPGSFTPEQVQAAEVLVDQANDRLSANTERFADVLRPLFPDDKTFADGVGNWQRTGMLSAPSGRVQDLAVTGGLNAPREIVSSKIEGLIGSAVNAVTGQKGKLLDSGLSFTDLIKAVPRALKKIGQDIRGKGDSGSIEGVVKGSKSSLDKTDLVGRNQGPITRLVKAATNAPTRLTKGVVDSELARLARQEGQKRGFEGQDLDVFTKALSYLPTPDMQRKSKLVHERINNINANPISSMMRDIGNALEKNWGAPGTFIKNAIMPFPTWLGGNIYNAVTDRNVIINGLNALLNAKKDPQYAVQQLAKTITGLGEAITLGYVLTEIGVLTDKDAEGNSYEGLYLHLGDRYIPVQSIGNFAPNIILGYSAHRGLNNEQDDGSDPDTTLQNIGQFSSSLIENSFKSLGVGSLTGSESYLTRGITEMTKGSGKDGRDVAKGAATIGSGFVGQFIPAAGGDVNSVLDNYTGLNPTKEAADTKVIDPNSPSGKATEPIGTALNKLQNRIPFASQNLPRKEGVAAKDPIDRITKGNRDMPGAAAARDLEVSESEKKVNESVGGLRESGVMNDKIKNILDDGSKKIFDKIQGGKKVTEEEIASLMSGVTKGITEDSDTRFLSDGDYDSNLAVLKTKRDMLKADPTTRQDTLDSYEDQIKRGEVYKELKPPYKLIKDYKDISLEEWRALGNPESDEYSEDTQKLYQSLWELDTAMTKAGVSRLSSDKTKQKYYLKKPGKGRGRGGGGGNRAISSNTVGAPVNLGKVNLSMLSKSPAGIAPIPKVLKLRSSELVKKRKISIGK